MNLHPSLAPGFPNSNHEVEKAGQDKGQQSGRNRPPIVISRTVLESYFNMQQRKVCDELVSFCAVILRVVISAQLECLCHDLMGVD